MPILRDSHDNLRAALEWLAGVDRRDELVELVSVLSGFWLRDSHYLEGRRRITGALALEGAGSPRARATALRNLSAIASTLGDPRAALGFAANSVRLWEAVGDVHGLADALRVESMVLNDLGDLGGARRAASLALGHAQSIGDDRTIRGARHELAYLAVQANDLGSALALLEENAEAMRLADDRLGLAATLSNLGSIQRMLGAHGHAEGSARQAIEILRTTGDDASLGSVLTTLGAILVDVGRLDEARAALVEGLAIAWRAGALHELPEMLEVLGDLWRQNGDAFRAVELYAAASVLRDASGSGLSANDLDAALADARRDLASGSYGQAWRSGSTTPLDELVEDELRRQVVPDAGNRRSGAGS
jgi:tetratricopeptide (TPR) repeat protein